MVLAIYGAGGSGKELYEMTQVFKNRWEKIVFIDDTQEDGIRYSCERLPFDSFVGKYNSSNAVVSIAVGEPAYRELFSQRVKECGYKLETIIHPNAEVSPSAILGEGVIVKSGAIISADAVLENNVWIQSRSIIGHDTFIGENSQISSYSVIAGHTKVGRNVYIGVGALIRENLNIGQDSIISMGAVVLKSVNECRIVMGNPGREIAKNENRRVFK